MVVGPDWIYIRVPRTASTSITDVLRQYHTVPDVKAGSHMPISYYINNVHPEHCNKWTWAVVRNPWDRIVSRYYYDLDKRLKTDRKRGAYQDFRAWISDGLQDNGWIAWCQQSRWVMENTLCVRYENLEKEWRQMCKRMRIHYKPLPRKHVSEGRKPYQWYYQPDTIAAVSDVCKGDIKKWKYSYVSGV